MNKFSNPQAAATLRATRHRRTLNALSAALDRVMVEADNEDPASLEDADDLLDALALIMSEMRSRARAGVADKLAKSRALDLQRLQESAEVDRILGREANLQEELQRALAAGDTKRADAVRRAITMGETTTPAPAAPSKEAVVTNIGPKPTPLPVPARVPVEPKPVDAETTKAVERVRALNKANKKAGKKS